LADTLATARFTAVAGMNGVKIEEFGEDGLITIENSIKQATQIKT